MNIAALDINYNPAIALKLAHLSPPPFLLIVSETSNKCNPAMWRLSAISPRSSCVFPPPWPSQSNQLLPATEVARGFLAPSPASRDFLSKPPVKRGETFGASEGKWLIPLSQTGRGHGIKSSRSENGARRRVTLSHPRLSVLRVHPPCAGMTLSLFLGMFWTARRHISCPFDKNEWSMLSDNRKKGRRMWVTTARQLTAIYFCSNVKLMTFCQVMMEKSFEGLSSFFVEQLPDSGMKEKLHFKPELIRVKLLRSWLPAPFRSFSIFVNRTETEWVLRQTRICMRSDAPTTPLTSFSIGICLKVWNCLFLLALVVVCAPPIVHVQLGIWIIQGVSPLLFALCDLHLRSTETCSFSASPAVPTAPFKGSLFISQHSLSLLC